MSTYRFILEPYKSMKTVHRCPNCKKRKFTRYIDLENNNSYLNNNVGKCSRLLKCNYHYPPKKYFQDTNYMFKTNFLPVKNKIITPLLTNVGNTKPISYITNSVKNSISHTKPNNFIHFLEKNLFGEKITKQIVDEYKIGTSSYWEGSTIFWQIDEKQKVRTGKIMLYDKETGMRIKKPYNYITWIHKVKKMNDFNLEQCFFGLHLINKYKDLPIAIVESEKTAIIASIYLPEFVWLACGGFKNLSKSKTEVLSGRDVVLFPDLKYFDEWKNKIPSLSNNVNFIVSNLLEEKSTLEEKSQDYDLADYLINMNIDFRKYIK